MKHCPITPRNFPKEEAKLDWQLPAVQLERNIRAFNPWPFSFLTLTVDGVEQSIKIHQATVVTSPRKSSRHGN